MDLKDILSFQLRFFREEELKNEIMTHSKLVKVPAGTVILNEGSYVKTVPILLSGLAKVIKEEGSKEFLLYYIYPLESCIVSINCGINQLKSKVKAITEEESTAIMVPAHLISEWQRKYKTFNDFILSLYQKRFDDVLEAFNALAFQSLDERLLSYLKAKISALDTNVIKMTHQDLSDELGASRETISRMLKKLEVDGLVKLHRGSIEVYM